MLSKIVKQIVLVTSGVAKPGSTRVLARSSSYLALVMCNKYQCIQIS